METPRIKRIAWRCCIASVALLIGVTYSPIVLRSNADDLWLLGLPWTLWTSLLTAFGIVLLTALGAVLLPNDDKLESETVQE